MSLTTNCMNLCFWGHLSMPNKLKDFPKNVASSVNVIPPHEQLLVTSNVQDEHPLLQSAIHSERAENQLCKRTLGDTSTFNVKQSTHLSPERPNHLVKKTSISLQWCYSTPNETTSNTTGVKKKKTNIRPKFAASQ